VHLADAAFVELAGSVYLTWQIGLPGEKRDLLQIVTSNRRVGGRSVDLKLSIPFDQIAKRPERSPGAPYRDRPRTPHKSLRDYTGQALDRLIRLLLDWFKTNPANPTPAALFTLIIANQPTKARFGKLPLETRKSPDIWGKVRVSGLKKPRTLRLRRIGARVKVQIIES